MLYLKKSLFGFLFLIFFCFFHFLILPLLTSYDWIFGFSGESALQLVNLAVLVLLTAFCFIIFASLSQDWRLGMGFSLLGSIVPLLFSQGMVAVVLAILYLIGLMGIYLSVENKMRKYYSFDPVAILGSSIKSLATLLAIFISVGYYLTINPVIAQKGFSLPESIIPDALINRLIDQQTSQFVQGDKYIAQVTPEMIQYAKEHPELLKQYGITPSQIDELEQRQPTSSPTSKSAKATQVPTTTSTKPDASMVKKLALEPINSILKEYQSVVAPILALILFSAFSLPFFIFFFFNVLSGFLIKSLFYILEKTNFIHFEKEMREVKKLVV